MSQQTPQQTPKSDTPLTMSPFRTPGPVTPRPAIPLSPIYPNNLPTPPHSSQGPPKRAFEDIRTDRDESPSPSRRFRARHHQQQLPLESSVKHSSPNLRIHVTPFTPNRSYLMAAAPSVNRPVLPRVDSLGGAGQGFSSINMNDSPPTGSPLSSGHNHGQMSPPSTLPSVLSMKRANPKRLPLTLNMPNNSPPGASASDTPTSVLSDATRNTPITPETPRTPALAMSLPIRPKAVSRPSLLTLVTQPAAGNASNDVPPTPGPGTANSRTIRPKIRLRSSSSGTESLTDSIEARSARSASLGYPHVPVCSISEDSAARFASSSSSSPHGSTYTSLSTPPLIEEHPEDPYANGPIEMFPGVYLGAEDSVFHWRTYAGSSSRVRILNVAQEIDDPFMSATSSGTGKGKEREKINLADYEADAWRPKVEYAHLLWGHGESGLADIPVGATLDQVIHPKPLSGGETKWGFWEAIQWMEEGRREQVPILIQ